jgi:hypothetical protein
MREPPPPNPPPPLLPPPCPIRWARIGSGKKMITAERINTIREMSLIDAFI